MGKRKKHPYKIIGAYDSETCNIAQQANHYAYPILHQLGLLQDCEIGDVSASNVEDVCEISLYRHTADLYTALETLANNQRDFVPVIACHNLAFDCHALASWLLSWDESKGVKVSAKSPQKPITFTLLDDIGNPCLVIWDTLVFSQQGLARMGRDCGYLKAVGEWDYMKIRTPETPLDDNEIAYAKKDIYALLAWLGWWIRRNPDIDSKLLGQKVLTKTGIVRERRRVRFSNLKGRTADDNVGKYWMQQNVLQKPKNDDELFLMQACTRGGFTFCASKFASVPFDLGDGYSICGYDAVSMHPAQMVSHYFPERFRESTPENLDMAFALVGRKSPDHVMGEWRKPFNSAFNAAFYFEGLRPKKGSLFEKWGIYPLAYERFGKPIINDDNGDAAALEDFREKAGYKDRCTNPVYAFGKLVSADSAYLHLTELAAWEVWQAYEWDSVHAVHGYIASEFTKPVDMSILSVMQFFKAKNEFKRARSDYYSGMPYENLDELVKLGIPEQFVKDLEDGRLSDLDIEAQYLSLKADLNSLFGIEATNEYRRDTVLGASGIEYTGEFGVCNAPKAPKAWYQFGQRIVAWSRVAQICAMHLIGPHVDGIINGDTDSLKVLVKDSNTGKVAAALEGFSRCIDLAKAQCITRIKREFPALFDPLGKIGHYELEFTAKRFCAAWNKAYLHESEGKYHFTLAGIPTKDVYRDGQLDYMRLDGYASKLEANGYSFADICNLLLGYNLTISHDLTGLNARAIPEWGQIFDAYIMDYLGNECHVVEPASLALYPMEKTIGDTDKAQNRANSALAVKNNPDVNLEPMMVSADLIFRNPNDVRWLS